MTALYPLKFAPLYRTRVWGGTLMGETLHRELPPMEGPVGEAWDIADRPDAVSTVVNGPLAGRTLRQLMEFDAPALAGPHLRGDRFPLIVKIIDAGDRLSLQVHPDDAAAAAIGGGAEGIEPQRTLVTEIKLEGVDEAFDDGLGGVDGFGVFHVEVVMQTAHHLLIARMPVVSAIG